MCRPMSFCFTHTGIYAHTHTYTHRHPGAHTCKPAWFYVRWENGMRISSLGWYKQHLLLPLKVPRTNQSTVLLKLEDIEFICLLTEHSWGAVLRSVGDPNTAALSGKTSSMDDGFPIDGAPFYVPSQPVYRMLWDMLIINNSRSINHIYFKLDIIKALSKN